MDQEKSEPEPIDTSSLKWWNSYFLPEILIDRAPRGYALRGLIFSAAIMAVGVYTMSGGINMGAGYGPNAKFAFGGFMTSLSLASSLYSLAMLLRADPEVKRLLMWLARCVQAVLIPAAFIAMLYQVLG